MGHYLLRINNVTLFGLVDFWISTACGIVNWRIFFNNIV
jgi:hypothetical protein